MAVIGTPVVVAVPVAGSIAICDANYVRPSAAEHDGCPILTRLRTLVVDKGVCETVQWTLMSRDGQSVDLSTCFTATDDSLSLSSSVSISESTFPYAIKVRFSECDTQCIITEITATLINAAGVVRFQLPASVVSDAGIYRMQLGILDSDDNVIFTDHGLLSVERGLWGNTNQVSGPLTLKEIRTYLRDTPAENSLLDDFEFDADEIIMALIRPVQEWNETPPPIQRFTCKTFPYRRAWLDAVVYELMQTAAHNYLRNKMQASHGGLTVDDKNKNKEYLQTALLYREQWRNFLVHKKAELNARRAYGSV